MNEMIYRAPDDLCYKTIFQIKEINEQIAENEQAIEMGNEALNGRPTELSPILEAKIKRMQTLTDRLRYLRDMLQDKLLKIYGITVE